VSYSQTGSAAALARPPDLTLATSIISSANTRSLLQRKLGLYISSLTASLAARAANTGHAPTQYALLGDAAINAANSSTRHKNGLYAYHRALCAVIPPDAAPPSVQLCDRGDSSPQSKEEARQRWTSFNGPRGESRGHVPDVAVFTTPPTLHEFKCYTFANQRAALGHGTAVGGAKASAAEGHVTAFGGTEERLRWENLGVAQRGTAGGAAFQRATGDGYVAAHDRLYADALAKGLRVVLAVMETSGGVSAALEGVIRLLARTAAAKQRRHRQHPLRPGPRLHPLLLRAPYRGDVDGRAGTGRRRARQRRCP
jgi:hypothetical protein